MTRNKLILTAVFLLVVGGLYWYVYKDDFATPTIQVGHSYRTKVQRRGAAPLPPSRNDNLAAPLVFTFFGKEYRLTSVKVVSLEAYKSNRFIIPLWEMVSSSNSAPVKDFKYGQNIPGMQPAVTNARPEPLASNVTYRLFVQAGKKLKGQCDFTLGDNLPPPTPQSPPQ